MVKYCSLSCMNHMHEDRLVKFKHPISNSIKCLLVMVYSQAVSLLDSDAVVSKDGVAHLAVLNDIVAATKTKIMNKSDIRKRETYMAYNPNTVSNHSPGSAPSPVGGGLKNFQSNMSSPTPLPSATLAYHTFPQKGSRVRTANSQSIIPVQ